VKRATIPLIAIAILFTGAGAVLPHLRDAGDERGLSFLLSIVCAVLLFIWCKAHASARGIDPPAAAALLVGLIAPIGVPYYFFRSMPWSAASWATVKAIVYFLGITVLGIGAENVSAFVT
jgi:hypothetical protein